MSYTYIDGEEGHPLAMLPVPEHDEDLQPDPEVDNWEYFESEGNTLAQGLDQYGNLWMCVPGTDQVVMAATAEEHAANMANLQAQQDAARIEQLQHDEYLRLRAVDLAKQKLDSERALAEAEAQPFMTELRNTLETELSHIETAYEVAEHAYVEALAKHEQVDNGVSYQALKTAEKELNGIAKNYEMTLEANNAKWDNRHELMAEGQRLAEAAFGKKNTLQKEIVGYDKKRQPIYAYGDTKPQTTDTATKDFLPQETIDKMAKFFEGEAATPTGKTDSEKYFQSQPDGEFVNVEDNAEGRDVTGSAEAGF